MTAIGWAARSGCRIERHRSVASTNTLALDYARAGELGPLWITAGEQTAGRGRHGRTWHSPAGNLHATRLIVAAPPAERLTGLAFVAAVAVHQAVAGLLPEPARSRLRLKWPNDVMVDGAKLSGILVEVERVGAGFAAAVGIGVNVAGQPDRTGRASLAGLGAVRRPAEVFDRVGARFEERLAEWDDGRGFAAIRASWLARSMPAGTPTTVAVGADRVSGSFRGLADDGALLVELAGGRIRRIAAGEVVTPPGAE